MGSHFASEPHWDEDSQETGDAGSRVAPEENNDLPDRGEWAPGQRDSGGAPRKKKRVWPLVVLLVVLLCIAAAGAAFLVYYNAKQNEAISSMDSVEAPATPEESAASSQGSDLAQNPIDFASLAAENSDIFAWLYIPGCNINTPLFQSPTDDLYYLWRNKDKQEDLYGSPFIQLCNSRDLQDSVTVVYGHRNEGAFEPLLQFQDQSFFDANKEFYVYVPGHIYTYTLVSSYIYDTRHIMNSFDFSNPEVLASYFEFVQNPDSISSCVNPDASLDADSKLLQLSTCSTTHGESDGRFIVSAVRTADQETY